MSRRRYTARGKVAIKNTRGGVVERNAATGEDRLVSQRESAFDLRGGAPVQEPLPQLGANPGKAAKRSSQAHRNNRQGQPGDTFTAQQRGAPPEKTPAADAGQHGSGRLAAGPHPLNTGQKTKGSARRDMSETGAAMPGSANPLPETAQPTQPVQPAQPGSPGGKPPQSRFSDGGSLLKSAQGEPAHPQAKKARQQKRHGSAAEGSKDQAAAPEEPLNKTVVPGEPFKPEPAERADRATGPPVQPEPAPQKQAHGKTGAPRKPLKPGGAATGKTAAAAISGKPKKTAVPSVPAQPAQPGKLQFKPDEAAPEKFGGKPSQKLVKAGRKAARAGEKLERAQDRLPAKRKLRAERVFSENSGKAQSRLYFEKNVKTRQQHLKGPLPLRPAKAGANAAIAQAHRKIYQVEDDNVGVKGAHRIETAAEAGTRSALRFRKTAPYRKAARLEQAARKKSANLTYRQALDRDPKLKSNILSRMWQKRKIKKDYAKAAHEAKKAAQRAKKAGSMTAEAGKAVVGVIKRHPVITAILIALAILVMILTSCIGTAGSMGGGGAGAVILSTYLAEDPEMLAAEAAYSGMEAALQNELDNYPAYHPGYDEYRFDLDDIGHDPYVLISILSALHEGQWALADVQGTLSALFPLQYTLTETVAVETRYRTETVTLPDDATGGAYEAEVDVAYDYSICSVTLGNFNLSHLPIYIMGEDSLSRYALYMATHGNRPDLFPQGAYPNASTIKQPTLYDIPPEYLEDEAFAAIIAEAERWIGMPYVWGGYSPATSFDCSGYVSWVINHSGWNVGRLDAQGLCNICSPVPAPDAKPGDLVFFEKTYASTDTVTHVGIYVGDGMMLHCGDPIGFISIYNSYYTQHLYAYGRLP